MLTKPLYTGPQVEMLFDLEPGELDLFEQERLIFSTRGRGGERIYPSVVLSRIRCIVGMGRYRYDFENVRAVIRSNQRDRIRNR